MTFDLTGGSSAAPVAKASGRESTQSGRESSTSVPAKVLERFSRKKRNSSDASGKDDRRAPQMSFGTSSADAFEVSVRNADPIIRRLEERGAVKAWTKDLQLNLATAAVIMAMLSLLMTAAEEPKLILFCIPAFVVIMILSTIEALDMGKVKLIVAGVIAAVLVVTLIVLRKYIGNGLALTINQLYDTGEAAQAYLYKRLPTGSMAEEHPHRSMHMAALWMSTLLGLLTALPPARYRRTVALGAGIFSMLAFSYYGIIPALVCIAVLATALLFVLARGSIVSALPVFLIAAILFGAILLIDPGESYGISRADENFRDRFALKSAYLQQNEEFGDPFSDMDDELMDDEEESDTGDTTVVGEHKGLVFLLILLLVLAAAGVFARKFMKQLQKRQLENRAGINSQDPKEAITAMFPYTVRWLQPAGIEAEGKAFTSLMPMIRSEMSEEYAKRFSGMYDMWEEAAYSDHEMDEASRQEMNSFMNDTINTIKSKGNFATQVRNTIKYAL